MAFRAGVVAILGLPNAGKSTLLNALVGQKIAIVTHKAQTTRHRIQGVIEIPARKKPARPAAQIVLVDTPGVLTPVTQLDRRMLQEIHDALDACDAVALIVDATRTEGGARSAKAASNARLLEFLEKLDCPVFLLLNKIDQIAKPDLLPLIEQWRARHAFTEIIPISALKDQGLETLVDTLVAAMPEGERKFPADQVTDQPERLLVAELVREQILIETGEEVPYSTAVVVERFEEPTADAVKRGAKGGKPVITRIAIAIFCEREGQKAILIGKGGAMLKKIGSSARHQIEEMLGTKVFLELFVKVRENWRDSPRSLDDLDWRAQLESLTTKPE
jgi:GTPase